MELMKSIFTGILLAVAVLFFTTALGLSVIQLTGFPYSVDIDYLKISESSGLTREEVRENYDAIMDFLSPFSAKEFSLPTISFSDRAAKHFEDCKPLFNAVYILGAVSALILALLAATKSIGKTTLRVSSAVTLALPALIGVAVASDFDRSFTLFHKLFFEGSTWIFDPQLDSFILIFPSEFFMHCAIFIALFWVLGAMVQLTAGYLKREIRKI